MKSEANKIYDHSNEVPADAANPLDALRFPGRIEIVGDITAPCYTDQEYEEFFEASCAQLEGSAFYRRKDDV